MELRLREKFLLSDGDDVGRTEHIPRHIMFCPLANSTRMMLPKQPSISAHENYNNTHKFHVSSPQDEWLFVEAQSESPNSIKSLFAFFLFHRSNPNPNPKSLCLCTSNSLSVLEP